MTKQTAFTFFFLLFITNLLAQTYTSIIADELTKQPIAYANVGILGKNIGTVSNDNGWFTIEAKNLNDTLKISFIGYASLVNTFQILQTTDTIYLSKTIVDLKEIVIKPQNLKTKIFGVTAKNLSISVGFSEGNFGGEIGVLMKNKHKAYLQKLYLNFSSTYDSLFYRINIYQQGNRNEFINILTVPIYFKIPAGTATNPLIIDLAAYNISVEGKFLVTMEFIKDLGEGHLFFNAALFKKSFARETSQSEWETIPIGISMSVEALVRK